jgi:hypothetical protein
MASADPFGTPVLPALAASYILAERTKVRGAPRAKRLWLRVAGSKDDGPQTSEAVWKTSRRIRTERDRAARLDRTI